MSAARAGPARARGLSFSPDDATQRLYLRPTALLHGAAAQSACAGRTALPLAGGPAAFAACEVFIRRGAAIRAAVLDLPRLRRWAGRREGRVAEMVEERLQRLSAPRPDFAGLALGRPLLMGIINVTPDSFSDGGDFADPRAAIAHGKALLDAGADILDVGGESTRPGAAPISPEAECARILPVVRALAGHGAVVSVDSRRAPVMEAAIAAGARIVNDVTALSGDPLSLGTVARSGAAVVLMHMQGEPRTMQLAPRYTSAPLDVYDFLEERLAACAAAGIGPARLALDPGIGFGKTVAHNLEILGGLALYHGLGAPLLVGVSRKSFIGRLSRGEPPKERLAGSLAAAVAAWEQGVQILRVHDVAETAQARAVWRAMTQGAPA
jgi:dihydropteroate synthase